MGRSALRWSPFFSSFKLLLLPPRDPSFHLRGSHRELHADVFSCPYERPHVHDCMIIIYCIRFTFFFFFDVPNRLFHGIAFVSFNVYTV
jgi:hypothetical protein